MMNRKEILDRMFEAGKADALDLRVDAVSEAITDTEIIDREICIPDWREDGDYLLVPAGSPFRDNGQVYGLLQPHNASHYPNQRPSDLRALWGLKHTTNPERAKPYVAPIGTSGLYMADECCLLNDKIYKSKVDNNAYSPVDYPQNWEEVDLQGDE